MIPNSFAREWQIPAGVDTSVSEIDSNSVAFLDILKQMYQIYSYRYALF